MDAFDQKLAEIGQYPLRARKIDTFVVNFGLEKNPRSMYYYGETLNPNTAGISLEVIDKTLDVLRTNRNVSLIEITGTSPETNPHFKYFVEAAREMGNRLAVVSNPAVYSDPGMEDMPEFLAKNKVKILAFVPHYEKDVVDRSAGEGTFDKIVSSFRQLNETGYSREGSDLTTAFVYLPHEPKQVPEREILKQQFLNAYRDEHGINFNHFIVFNTIPIGRFSHEDYVTELKNAFNPDTIKNLPCGHALSISADGRFYDCDFTVAADTPVRSTSRDLDSFEFSLLENRETAVSEKCFICTAGEGATCAECFS